jgi:hypothetical protein
MRWRLGLWVGLILGWLVMLLYLWAGFLTFPSAERLEHSRMMAIPTLRTLGMLAGRSALELGGMLVLLWPWWARFWVTRMLAAALLVAAWFIVTTPLTVSTMDWMHRRWLVVNVGVLLVGCVVVVAARLAFGFARAAPPPPPAAT